MIVKEVTDLLEELAPLEYAEEFDNVGLLVGDANAEVTGVLVTLDTLENVVEEAIEKSCNLIVSFHPIIFKGLKRLTGKTYVERVVLKAIRNDIAIYSMHTALDNVAEGVNHRICQELCIQDHQPLIPQKGILKKLTTYVPTEDAEKLSRALFDAGAGSLGKYSDCSFRVEGTGSFTPGSGSTPAKGSVGKIHYEAETQINVTFTVDKESAVLRALFESHPYEEVAYEVYALENTNQHSGMGRIGMLEKPMSEEGFLNLLKDRMQAEVVRHSQLLGKEVQKVAVLGGSGAFAIKAARAAGADVFVTADIKYHQFYEAEGKLLLTDIGHYETEQFTKNLLVDYLTKKIPNFAVCLSESRTNPIKYF
ncbi:Nif3-like dinuclear metal center hexameric protein [Poritiphilus flavus]|uniref:GTP cyclohydrolase 1 type 2 homolog n=1 Tax=Poritiphilus flavus TaxID=2697053 RepID=A0A6L9EAX6_9FLAO|nr:Nif3-like dinuclear metal center hexameric protein [Poritiphilus flavus]NAS11742.1 Nif3-like dinuclear metal center hexameric protein [Poritiphilus flavus]